MLWIRSQNKKILIKASELFVQKHYGNWVITDYPEDVPAVGDIALGGGTGGALNLGKYKTEKRAFEVLDEIQQYIEKQGTNEILANDNGIPNGSIYYGKVYEMPAE